MAMPQIFEEPKKPLGAVTAVVAAFGGIFAYGQDRGDLGMIVVLLVPVVILALVARTSKGFRGWLLLVIAWVLGVLGAGAILGVN